MTSVALRVAPSLDSPAPPRRERNAVETRRRLLDAAEAEFASKGFDGARLGNIARVAGVQSALIHHYFVDKDGLYREVLTRGLAALAKEGESLLARLAKKIDASELRPLTTALVELLLRFYATHGALLAILRHEGDEAVGPSGAHAQVVATVIADYIKPVFDGTVAYIEAMKRRGFVRSDVDARHLCVSGFALAGVTFHEERMLRGVWPVDMRSKEFLAERQREIVDMILARAVPSEPSRSTSNRITSKRVAPKRKSPRRS